jgi:hypothetical protein
VKYDDSAFYRDKKRLSSKIERSFGFYVDSPLKLVYILTANDRGVIPEDRAGDRAVGPKRKHIGLSILLK